MQGGIGAGDDAKSGGGRAGGGGDGTTSFSTSSGNAGSWVCISDEGEVTGTVKPRFGFLATIGATFIGLLGAVIVLASRSSLATNEMSSGTEIS